MTLSFEGRWDDVSYEVEFCFIGLEHATYVANELILSFRLLGIIRPDLESKAKNEIINFLKDYLLGVDTKYKILSSEEIAEILADMLWKYIDSEVAKTFNYTKKDLAKDIDSILFRHFNPKRFVEEKDEIISEINKALDVYAKADPKRFELLKQKNVSLIFVYNEYPRDERVKGFYKYLKGKHVIYIFKVRDMDYKDILLCLAHEVKHVEQKLRGIEFKEYRKLPYWERPHEKEAKAYELEIWKIAESLGLLGVAFLVVIVLGIIRRRRQRL